MLILWKRIMHACKFFSFLGVTWIRRDSLMLLSIKIFTLAVQTTKQYTNFKFKWKTLLQTLFFGKSKGSENEWAWFNFWKNKGQGGIRFG